MPKKIEIELFNGPWVKSDLDRVEKHGHNVLSTFSCGGGSSYGYKLAGFDVVGCVEIDPKIYKTYLANHSVAHPMNMSIQEFNRIPDCELPEDFFKLDVLDGSPPCSTFSIAGSREKKWGGEHYFREGQAKQKLDELFFDFISTAKKLKPKVVVAENVKGLIQGNAKGYVKQIFKGFRDAGYTCQLFLLDASSMGVPQRRERTFFIANRLNRKIKLSFDEKPIGYRRDNKGKKLGERDTRFWKDLKPGQGQGQGSIKGGFNCLKKAHDRGPTFTLSATSRHYSPDEPRFLSDSECFSISTFPDDYQCDDAGYICGMSVPPYMMQRIAKQIYEQVLFNG